MPVLNNVTVADNYANNVVSGTTAAILTDVWNSRGGWFSVSGAAVFVQMQYGENGSEWWTEEVEVGAGAFAYLAPSCVGVRFRNAVAGNAATVTAQISEGDEPPLSIIALGSISLAGVGAVTRTVISAVGATAYSVPAGCTAILVELIGGGGAGGAVPATAAGTTSAGGGGGGGAYAAKVIATSSLTAPLTVNVGAGGTAGDPAGSGTASSFVDSVLGTLVQAAGGAGCATAIAAAPPHFVGGASGAGGTIAGSTGDTIRAGGPGYNGACLALTQCVGGAGGNSGDGGGGRQPHNANGNGLAGQVPGGGGSGAVATASQPASVGGAGAAGVAVITEFYS